MDLTHKNTVQKIVTIILKAGIVITAFGYIYNQLFVKQDIQNVKNFANNVIDESIDYICLGVVLVLMLINWGIESKKWHFLICKFEKICFKQALKADFAGTCISIFTPNRIGEFGGRIFYLNNANRIQAILATIIGNIGQLFVTIALGSCSFVFYLTMYSRIDLSKIEIFLIIFFLSGFVLSLLFLFLNANKITPYLNKVSIISLLKLNTNKIKKWKKYTAVFSMYTATELLKVLSLCFLRYVVFCLQFYILLYIFEVKSPFSDTMAMISLSFLILAIVPTVALTEIGVRGSVALFFIGLLSDNSIGIISASILLWVINLVLPAIIGSFCISDLIFFRTKTKNPDLLTIKAR